jgi:hypothetical protein
MYVCIYVCVFVYVYVCQSVNRRPSHGGAGTQRLAAAYRHVADTLARLGAPCLPAHAGFFVWADLRAFLPAATPDHERALFAEFLDAGVYIGTLLLSPPGVWCALVPAPRWPGRLTPARGWLVGWGWGVPAPGAAFRCSEPGWFRIIIGADHATLDVALARIAAVLARRPRPGARPGRL